MDEVHMCIVFQRLLFPKNQSYGGKGGRALPPVFACLASRLSSQVPGKALLSRGWGRGGAGWAGAGAVAAQWRQVVFGGFLREVLRHSRRDSDIPKRKARPLAFPFAS